MEVILLERLLGLQGIPLSFTSQSRKRLLSFSVIVPMVVSGEKNEANKYKSPLKAFNVKRERLGLEDNTPRL
jgi:hypothetical protein